MSSAFFRRRAAFDDIAIGLTAAGMLLELVAQMTAGVRQGAPFAFGRLVAAGFSFPITGYAVTRVIV